jgi:20S proteasome alpha/beta subunit
MTICIAAISKEEINNKEEEYIVFAVDHMLSNNLLGEFEHDIKKYHQINQSTVLMLSGRAHLMEYFTELENSNENIDDILEVLKTKFKEKRLEIIQSKILDPSLMDLEFIKENLDKEFKNSLVKYAYREILSTQLDTTILLAGFKRNKAKIFELSDTGVINLRTINFHAIGSGSIQALNALLFQNHSIKEDLKTTIYNVFKAKKNAEVMQGVGKETELGYLSKDGVILLKKKDLNTLENIYNCELNYGKNHKNLRNLKLR